MRKRKVLVVENDPMSRELCKRVLERGGFAVTCCHDGEEALLVAGALDPDLVLMDLGLPGMDGVETTKRLREASLEAPIAVLSAQAFGEDLDRARKAGCVRTLTKPIGARALLDEVNALLEDAR